MHAQGKETDKTRRRAGRGRPSGRAPAPGPAAGILALQRAAGNAAVARAVEEQRHEHDANCGHGPSVQRSRCTRCCWSPGRPLDAPLQTEMEGRYGGEDFGVAVADHGALRAGGGAVGEGVGLRTRRGLGRSGQARPRPRAGSLPSADPGPRSRHRQRLRADDVRSRGLGRGPGGGERPAGDERGAGPCSAPSTTRRSGAGRGRRRRGRRRSSAPVSDVQRQHPDPLRHGNSGIGCLAGRDQPGQTATSAQLGVGADGLRHGSGSDDVTRRHFGSGNVEFSQRGTIPDTPQAHRNGAAYKEREARVRNALVDAKEDGGDHRHAGGGRTCRRPAPRCAQVRLPAFQRATPQQIEPLLSHVVEVLTRVQTGLNA